MLDSALARALPEGALLVTPNRRLARHLAAAYDHAQRSSGQRAWRAPQAMPWSSFVERLWQDALRCGAMDAPPLLLAPPVVARLWETILAEEGDPLVDVAGAARSAAEAWTLFHAWRRDETDSMAAWQRAHSGDDARVFARWAARYAAALERHRQTDLALAPDALRRIAGPVLDQGERRIVLAGFRDFTPQERRLIEALSAAGAEIQRFDAPRAEASRFERFAAADGTDELTCAFAWARRQVEAGATRVGIVVRDLARRRDAVIACAEETLCPELMADAQAARPYDISLGLPLSEAPIVFAALTLIRLAQAPVPLDDACLVVRSPYLPEAEARWTERAALERAWRARGARTRSWRELIIDLGTHDLALSQRWSTATFPGDRRRPALEWMLAWRAWLDQVGFPGERALSSAEWQAREAWSRLLAQFSRLDAIAPAVSSARALDMLSAMASEQLFQPEGPIAPVTILGLLEAPGLDFDGLWLAGMSADAWPSPPRPAPLLPIPWQRERGVPGSSAETEQAFAADLMRDFRGAAPWVIASHAVREEDYEHAPSPLIAGSPEITREALGVSASRALAIAEGGARPERFEDPRAPSLAADTLVRGGASLIESQSACPFQAFGWYRVSARGWEPLPDGLTPRERGGLLHDAFALLWKDLGDTVSLASLSSATMEARIAAAVDGAMGSLPVPRRKALPGAVFAAEGQRLRHLLRDWIEAVERKRPPFTVALTEWKTRHRLGGIELQLRFDRVDAMVDGGVAIVDYKSGEAPPPARWFAPRPSGTQLPLYAQAWRAQRPQEPVRALAYAIAKGGGMRVRGIVADEKAWPALDAVTKIKDAGLASWNAALAHLDRRLAEIALEFRCGEAEVTPRDAACCRTCNLQRLCRVQRLEADDLGASPDE